MPPCQLYAFARERLHATRCRLHVFAYAPPLALPLRHRCASDAPATPYRDALFEASAGCYALQIRLFDALRLLLCCRRQLMPARRSQPLRRGARGVIRRLMCLC